MDHTMDQKDPRKRTNHHAGLRCTTSSPRFKHLRPYSDSENPRRTRRRPKRHCTTSKVQIPPQAVGLWDPGRSWPFVEDALFSLPTRPAKSRNVVENAVLIIFCSHCPCIQTCSDSQPTLSASSASSSELQGLWTEELEKAEHSREREFKVDE